VYSASVGLVAPLVNRSAIEAQFDAAKASQIEAMYDYQKVILGAYVEVANGMTDLAGSSKIVQLKKAQKAALEQTVEAADILYRAGKATYVEVLIAQQNALAAELELVGAMKGAHVAKVRIYQALGGGWR
jgi:outer membrane protein TolC